MDALLATVQMPTGIPVATVAVNGAGNAAHLAAQMLALSDETLAAKLEEGKKKMEEEVVLKDQKMQQMAEEI
jgi:5-(carboxyamino)imidazole ribonucleotide mutase